MELLEEIDLRPNNTLGLRAVSRMGAIITEAGQLPELFAKARNLHLPVRVIGGGSNVILRPYYPGVTALISTKGRRIVDEDGGDHTIVEAAAGESWDDFVSWTIATGYGGLENLAGIPGSVGAAPVQNIGAYGLEVAELFHSLIAYDAVNDRLIELDRTACGFGYRDSIFKRDGNQLVITTVRLSLPKQWAPRPSYAGLEDAGADPGTIASAVRSLRAQKIPDWHLLGNVGSFFKNPILSPDIAVKVLDGVTGIPRFLLPDGQVKVSAAALVEACGFKGYRNGGVGVSQMHALVIVNYGDGTWAEVQDLARIIVSQVESRFGVTLVEEPLYC